MKISNFFIFFVSYLSLVFAYKHNPNDFLICSKLNCPVAQGVCTKDNRCACFGGFTTVIDSRLSHYQCNYEKKSQTLAFLLEFIIGFGVGHFYMENYFQAVVKLLFCFITTLIICFVPYFSISLKIRKLRDAMPYLQTTFGITYCVWQVVDGVMIGLSLYTDGNGVALKEW